jgi:CheY-like chemotaxis protein
VDDQAVFADALRKLLERHGIDVVGVASTSADALAQARALAPDLALIDVQLGAENGFDLARRLAGACGPEAPNMILISARADSAFADRVAVSPVLGFLSKAGISADAILDLLDDRAHGDGCRHEAFIYSDTDQFVAVAAPFVRHGLDAQDAVLVVSSKTGQAALQAELGADAGLIEFADSTGWYPDTRHAFDAYSSYIGNQRERGANRMRIIGDVRVTVPPAKWALYETSIGAAMGALPVSFLCGYDARELPERVVADARRTHPLIRSVDGTRPSAEYALVGA